MGADRRLLEIAYPTKEGSSESMAPSREGPGTGENPTAPAFGRGSGYSPTPSLRLASVALPLGISAICFTAVPRSGQKRGWLAADPT